MSQFLSTGSIPWLGYASCPIAFSITCVNMHMPSGTLPVSHGSVGDVSTQKICHAAIETVRHIVHVNWEQTDLKDGLPWDILLNASFYITGMSCMYNTKHKMWQVRQQGGALGHQMLPSYKCHFLFVLLFLNLKPQSNCGRHFFSFAKLGFCIVMYGRQRWCQLNHT